MLVYWYQQTNEAVSWRACKDEWGRRRRGKRAVRAINELLIKGRETDMLLSWMNGE